jgi:hypothetical protein
VKGLIILYTKLEKIHNGLATFYNNRDKISQIQPPELIVHVIDFVTEVQYWETFKKSIDKEEDNNLVQASSVR